MIYFDNSATTNYKPLRVKWGVLQALSKKYSANPGRSSHTLSINAALKIIDTRELISKLFHLNQPNNVIFTSGCTESLNLAIFGSLKEGGHVVTTIFEHNAVLRPLFYLEEKGLIELTILKPNEEGNITVKELNNVLKENTYLMVVNHTSNVTGHTANLKEIGNFCKKHQLIFIVDAAQSGGHQDIDVKENNIHLLALAGHKGFYGPQGVGVLLVNDIRLKPLKFGGTGISGETPTMPTIMPESLEAGTTCTPLIFGLYEGIVFTQKNKQLIKQKTTNLTKYLLEELDKIKEITVYTKKDFLNGVVSFNLKEKTSEEVSNELNSTYKICVRSGLHCAPLLHHHFGTLETGMVRVSFSVNNKLSEVKKLIFALKQMVKN